ncbi:MAG: hypothetical protein JNM51_11690 [Bacteroidia bacterium]|nr:hypothetical protein [Bacteroidia bacterium]
MKAFIILYFGISLLLFIATFLYANITSLNEVQIDKDWDQMKKMLKNRLKQNYYLKRRSKDIYIRLMFLDNRFIKNSIQVEPVLNDNNKIQITGRTDLKTYGFMVFLAFSFVFYIGAIYMYVMIKKSRIRAAEEIEIIANLSGNLE